MASRVTSRRWLLRDLSWVHALLVVVTCGVGLVAYFVDWSSVRRANAVRPQLDSTAKANPEQRYAGAIIVPMTRSLCLDISFDNRTGAMSDKGYVNCAEAISGLDGSNSHQAMEVSRLRAVGKAFKKTE